MTIMNRLSRAILFALLALSSVPSLLAGDKTAFDLIKEGNRYVGEQAKDKIVQIRSENVNTCPNTSFMTFCLISTETSIAPQ